MSWNYGFHFRHTRRSIFSALWIYAGVISSNQRRKPKIVASDRRCFIACWLTVVEAWTSSSFSRSKCPWTTNLTLKNSRSLSLCLIVKTNLPPRTFAFCPIYSFNTTRNAFLSSSPTISLAFARSKSLDTYVGSFGLSTSVSNMWRRACEFSGESCFSRVETAFISLSLDCGTTCDIPILNTCLPLLIHICLDDMRTTLRFYPTLLLLAVLHNCMPKA